MNAGKNAVKKGGLYYDLRRAANGAISHPTKARRLYFAAAWSPDGGKRLPLINSNAANGYENVALLDVSEKASGSNG